MFIHWLVGMVYVFYFASFVLVLREVLRPGVLWFLRNLNDPEFNPIQEVSLNNLHILNCLDDTITGFASFASTGCIDGKRFVSLLASCIHFISDIIFGHNSTHCLLSNSNRTNTISIDTSV
jgi:E3 ubiquitin-protein ligase DOA10